MKTLPSLHSAFGQRTLRWLSTATLLVAVVAPSFGRGKPASSEDSVKAAFVYNFAKLTKWPSSASSGPLVIGVIGSSGTGDAIKQIVDGKDAGGRKITVKDIAAGAAKSCQIVFVCGSGKAPATGGAPVLTVGESDGFADKGGAIGFVSTDGKVRFEINMGVIKKSDLEVSDKLTAIGKVVG